MLAPGEAGEAALGWDALVVAVATAHPEAVDPGIIAHHCHTEAFC